MIYQESKAKSAAKQNGYKNIIIKVIQNLCICYVGYNHFLKEECTMKHIKYIYIGIFMMCSEILMLNWWLVLYFCYSCVNQRLCVILTSQDDIASAVTMAFTGRGGGGIIRPVLFFKDFFFPCIVPHHHNEKSSVVVVESSNNGLKVPECNATIRCSCIICMQVKAVEADLFKQSVQMSR